MTSSPAGINCGSTCSAPFDLRHCRDADGQRRLPWLERLRAGVGREMQWQRLSALYSTNEPEHIKVTATFTLQQFTLTVEKARDR